MVRLKKKKDMTLEVACIQMNSQNDMEENLAVSRKWVIKAAKSGAEFVSLPENAAFMPKNQADWDAHIFEEATHPALAQYKVLAKEQNIYLHVGSIAVRKKGTRKPVNGSYVIAPSGRVLASYSKIHLFDASVNALETHRESARFSHGKQLVLTNIAKKGTLGLSICYDVRFPQLFRALAKRGASMIVVPAAFTAITGKAHWHVLLRARAIENGCFIIAAAQVGSHPSKRQTYGHSIVINPWGEIVAEKPRGVGMLRASINLAEVTEARGKIPSLQHDRTFS